MWMKKIIIIFLSIPKTLYLNFRLLSIKQAIKFPILCHYNTKISLKNSKADLGGIISPAMIKYGFGGSEGINVGKNFLLLKDAHIFFGGKARFMGGFSLKINGGKVSFGSNFNINKNGKIFCKNQIDFKNNIMIGWNVTIIDHDGHTILGNPHTGTIRIGSNTWIASEVYILKNVNLNNGNIVAARSLLTSSISKISEENILIGGIPAVKLKEEVEWIDEQI